MPKLVCWQADSEADQRQCLLVLMGATPDGQKELITVVDGYRPNPRCSFWPAERRSFAAAALTKIGSLTNRSGMLF